MGSGGIAFSEMCACITARLLRRGCYKFISSKYEDLPKEGDGQKEMDGTRDKNTMIIVCMRDGL